jgi:ArsR family transcriptional regulator
MAEPDIACTDHAHSPRKYQIADLASCQLAADIFRALGDPSRLRMLSMLVHDELCVSEIADALGDNLSAVSQRLKLLKSERIVAARRDGKHIYYKLSDHHVKDLVTNALAHVSEPHDHH